MQNYLINRIDTLALLELKGYFEARESFWNFRQIINAGRFLNKSQGNFWQHHACGELQNFAVQLEKGERPKLVIEAPPQHGKSTMIVDFVAWLVGRNPDLRVIYTSFSERLGERANGAIQRILTSERYKKIFPECRINEVGVPSADNAAKNKSLIEFQGRQGYFRNTTVRGQ